MERTNRWLDSLENFQENKTFSYKKLIKLVISKGIIYILPSFIFSILIFFIYVEFFWSKIYLRLLGYNNSLNSPYKKPIIICIVFLILPYTCFLL